MARVRSRPDSLTWAMSTGMAALMLITGTVGAGTPAFATSVAQSTLAGDLPGSTEVAVRAGGTAARPAPAWARKVPAGTTQVIRTVPSRIWCETVYCTRTEGWEKVGGVWRLAEGPGRAGLAMFRSQVGVRGFAEPGRRRADDLRSPSGIYPIKVVFSTTEVRPTSMPWRRRLPTSVVSSTPGQAYNTWLEVRGNSYGDRRMMSWGFWIDYNNPRLAIGRGPAPVQGLGSGIFLHTSNPGREWVPTLGCVQIGNPASAKWLVHWLRPAANPMVINNI